ncbi:hypothetical protein IRJ41_023631, partial [Triplophysa rosa]
VINVRLAIDDYDLLQLREVQYDDITEDCQKPLPLSLPLSQTETHTRIPGFLPASIDPFTPLKTKDSPPERNERGLVRGRERSSSQPARVIPVIDALL